MTNKKQQNILTAVNVVSMIINVIIHILNYKLKPCPYVSGYFRIRNFSFPNTATVHTHPENSTANPEKNKSALQGGKK